MSAERIATVMPLCPDDPKWARKARVAELHDLWLKSGCSVRVMQLLLDERRAASK